MATIIASPGRYIQERGALRHLTAYTDAFGKKILVLITASGRKRSGSLIEDGASETKTSILWDEFGGECCKTEIDKIVKKAKDNGVSVIVGVGGGKTLDTAKAAACYCKLPVVIAPTIASTDAPCSALSVIYTETGVFESYLYLPSNPDIVIVDTDVVAKAPARLLVSGMGDALATYFEARACYRSNANNCVGGSVSQAAMALARLCYETEIRDGHNAQLAVSRHACTRAVEHIIEANTYLSGVGFESGGLAAAHAIHNGFTAIPETHKMYHGEKVAFGTICQLVLEDAPKEELHEVLEFCKTVGLPITLAGLGIESATDEQILQVATIACAKEDTLHNMPFPVTPEIVCSAILAADEIGRYWQKK